MSRVAFRLKRNYETRTMPTRKVLTVTTISLDFFTPRKVRRQGQKGAIFPDVIILQKQHQLVVLLAKRCNRKTASLLTILKSFSIERIFGYLLLTFSY
jgi:hypothetical protein